MKTAVSIRRISQLFFLALFVYILWATTYPLTSIFSPDVLFQIDPLIMAATALSERVLLPGLIFSLVMIALTAIFGRFFCGWICPLGTIIDGVGACRHTRRGQLTFSQNAKVRRPKFFVLAGIGMLAILGMQVAWVLDPIVTVARVISLNVIPAVTLAIDRAFQFCIQRFGLYGGVYDFYRGLKSGFLGVTVHFFANAVVTFVFFVVIVGSAFFIARLWCRMLCPLGAWYAFNAQSALLTRKVGTCISCGACVRSCRMGAIEDGRHYRKGECILCMDCVYVCPEKSTVFSFPAGKEKGDGPLFRKKCPSPFSSGITRSQFLMLMASAISFVGLHGGRAWGAVTRKGASSVIRPPGAQDEERFVNACVRCGNCMKVCITNGLQPTSFEAGMRGMWTPQLVAEIGYCEYNCTLCGDVCPTGAIPKLPLVQKKKQRLGRAVIDHSVCLAWAGNTNCLVCEEHCPVADKAITTMPDVVNGVTILRPVVIADRCIGCGICQNKCPVRPVRAIRVH